VPQIAIGHVSLRRGAQSVVIIQRQHAIALHQVYNTAVAAPQRSSVAVGIQDGAEVSANLMHADERPARGLHMTHARNAQFRCMHAAELR
jgi:hypothetical protein